MEALLEGLFAALRRAISACTALYFLRPDDALVVVLYEVHGKLACILDSLAVDKVLPEGLLHN